MTLKEHIDDIRDKLEEKEFPNEAAVSDGIVRRLLKALDWPIYNPQLVCPEYRVDEGRVDFALCHPPSNPIIFIEVKQVGNIEWADQQLFGYALDYGGIPIAVVTDGQKWRFFHGMGQEDYKERKVRVLDFIQDNSEEIADCLNRYLNYQSIRTGEAVGAIKKDYEIVRQQKQEGLESKSVPPILPKLHPMIVPPTAEDNEVFDEAAWQVAYMRWGNRRQGPMCWEDVKAIISLTESSLESILTSDVYAHYVKHLMLTTRTDEQFHKWVHSYKKNMPKRFGDLMGLSPERVKQMVDEVTKEHKGATREEHNDDPNRDF